MTVELMAESVEYALCYGAAILAAIREADDQGIIANFRGFDAAARTAKACAIELRDLVAGGDA